MFPPFPWSVLPGKPPLCFQGLRSLGSSRVHGRCCVPAGCQLNTSTRTCVVKEDDDLLEHLVLLKTVRSEACRRARQSEPVPQQLGSLPRGLCLALQICLGAEARDELHVVAVDSKNTYGDHKPVPIAALRTSVLPMVRAAERAACSPRLWGDNFSPDWGQGSLTSNSLQISLKGLELVPPVTFVLKCGAGPVYLSGQHITRECCGARASVWARGCTGGGPVGPVVALVAPGALNRAALPQARREHCFWGAE